MVKYSGGSIKLIFPLLLLCSVLYAQSLSFKNFSTNDVLPSSTIYTAFQDSKGFMWFASDRGVCRYDGYNFTTYTTKDGLSDNDVIDMFEDSSGRIWFQTINGKISYYKDGEFFNSKKDSTLRALDSDSYITAIDEDKNGTIWIATIYSGFINYLKNGTVNRFFLNDRLETMHCLSVLAGNRIQLVTTLAVYQMSFNDNFTRITEGKKRRSFTRAIGFCKSCQLEKDEIIFCDENKVYLSKIQPDTIADFFSNKQRMLDVAGDEDYIWLSTDNGTVPYSRKTQVFLPAILKPYKVTSVVKDWEGNYWFTTMNSGIFFCTSLDMYSYTAKQGLAADHVSCLAKDGKGRLWIGYNEKGVLSYLSDGIVYTKEISNEEIFEAYQIRFFGNRCWLAASGGLYLIENSNVKWMGRGQRDIFEYPENNLWLGWSAGIAVAEIKGNSIVDFQLKKHRVRAKTFFLDSKFRLWLSTQEHLYQCTDDSLRVVKIELQGAWVNDFAELPDQTLVLATHGRGIVFFKDGKSVLTIGEAEGLTNNICSAVSIDQEGVIWVGTSEGLDKVSGYPHKIKIDHFNRSDGILAKEVSDVLVIGDTVWVATKSGLNFFNRDLVKQALPPRMSIGTITVQGKLIKHNRKEVHTLSYNENDIGIRYIGLSFQSSGNIQYRYKLRKGDPWKYTRNTTVSLPELPPDEYEFTVAGKGISGTWSKEASFSFTIQKPFWLTYGFILFAVVVFAMIVWAVAAYFFGHQKRKMLLRHKVTLSELKTLRAQMNPHFLFNALSSIQRIVLKNDPGKASDYVGRFAKLMREILDHSDKNAITIAEELESIKNYLDIEQMRTEQQFHYTIEIDPQLDIYSSEIPAMIIQPFIENAIWHGFGHYHKNGVLDIRFIMLDPDNTILIVIQDNGIGRRKAAALKQQRDHKSKGIQLVKERIDILNDGSTKKIELYIEDLEDEHGNHPGTRVTIKIPSE